MEAKVRGDPRELDIDENSDNMNIDDFTKHFGDGGKDPRVLEASSQSDD
jgi:hypothetical protein